AALVPGRAMASTTTCQPVNRPAVTVGVAGEPVATTPGVFVEVCVTVPSPEVTGTPAVRQEDYNCCSLALNRHFAVFLDSGVSSPPSTVTVSVTYSVDGVGDTETVSVPVGGTSGSSTCLFFRGSPANNPGGCLVFLEE
ncbi:MAG TPA: hypothetical protein VEV43_00270, partial [Actinomycetota bacterium]|nr:hypothetical protein [Actinomycetota bacterium]